MFKKKNIDISKVDTIIGANTTFEGNIQSEGTLRIDGKINGDIKTSGNVFIGNAAAINGNVSANDVHLSGRVDGNITAKGILKILSTAKLYGDIQVNSFVADEGGVFQGKCSMLNVAEDGTKALEAPSTKKLSSGKDYKKSSLINSVEDEKDKSQSTAV